MLEVFEPAEKKLEIRLSAGSPSLRCLPRSFWRDVVQQARAEIVKERHTERASALLLSESSLFLFDDHLTMITCGRSVLATAAEFLLRSLGTSSVESFSFQRRREQTDGRQWSSFEADVERLSRFLPGEIERGTPARLQRFSFTRRHAVPDRRSSLELYMFEVADPTPPMLDLATGFEVDEYRFEPEGHSLNAVSGESHWAIHVSPAPGGTYASIDAGDPRVEVLDRLFDRSLSLFRPRRWEAVLRRPGEPTSYVERSVELRVSYL